MRRRTSRWDPPAGMEDTLASLDDVSLAIGNLQARMGTLENDMAEIKTAISDLRDMANIGRGGWLVFVKQGLFISFVLGIGVSISQLWQSWR